MDKLVVRGRKRLTGEVTISGAKNAAVAVIPAAVMATGVSVLENLPSIEDVRNICHTIQEMGGKCRFLDNILWKLTVTRVSAIRRPLRACRKCAHPIISSVRFWHAIKRQRWQCPAAAILANAPLTCT